MNRLLIHSFRLFLFWVLTFSLWISPPVRAQEYVYDWVKTIGGNNDDYGNDVATDAAGNVYVTGTFSGTVDFDPGPGTYILTSSTPSMFVIKLDADGQLIWVKLIRSLNVGGGVFPRNITLDNTGNILIAGIFFRGVDFDPGPNSYIRYSNIHNKADVFILKLTPSGNFIMQKQFKTASSSYSALNNITDLVTDNNNNIYTIGLYRTRIEVNPGLANYYLNSNVLQAYLVKLDSAGNFQWAKTWDTHYWGWQTDLTMDLSGNLLVAGNFYGSSDIDPGPGTYTINSNGNEDIYLLKLDSDGNFIWAKTIGGIDTDVVADIKIDYNGNILLTGFFEGLTDFDPGPGVYQLTSHGGEDIFILKLNPGGQLIWVKGIGGTDADGGNAIAPDPAGNILVTGFFKSAVDFDPGPGVYTLTSHGGADIFVLSLKPDGSFGWAVFMGGNDEEGGMGIAPDPQNNILTTGTFRDSVDFDPGPGTDIHTSHGYDDIFIHKLKPYKSFIITWKTDNPGVTNNTSIRIPTYPGLTYNYDVDWNNDGVYDQTGITGSVTHDFGTPGTYTIRIRGQFPRIYFNDGGDKEKLLSVDQWGSIVWTSMESAFEGCSNLHINATDAPDLSQVTDMGYMLKGCSSFNENINHWNTEHVEYMNHLFDGAASFNQPLDGWNTSRVVNMSYMFANATAFNQPIGNWNTGTVRFFTGMFKNASSFNRPIGNWNTANAVWMAEMFKNAVSFNRDIGNWNTGHVLYMQHMFDNATAFNQPIGNWNTASVRDMSWMFNRAYQFNQPLSGWNTGQVVNMTGMFSFATAFNQPLNGWNTSNVHYMAFMFDHASAFNQPLDQWNTASVNTMEKMFNSASSFDQNLGGWNISSLQNAAMMFHNVTLSTSNYDALLIGWQGQAHRNNVVFDGGNSRYCLGEDARNILINQDGWTITDGGSEAPPVDTLPDTDTCDFYVLPNLTNGNYYTQSGGNGTQLHARDTLTTSQTVYIYATNGHCDNESSFDVHIYPTPQV
ncbi:MAG: BspA family leucine-rich repeat surface protein, partial [Chlorobi bacterium]|nr:BspA family leucine-rich repeat surface protein [Chlorobiota bacterium]